MLIRDRATISTRKTLPSGFLQVDAVLSRTGIQQYSAGELGLKDRNPREMVNIWRPAAEVFKPESMESFQMVPITDDHPQEDVTPENFRKLAVGFTGETVRQIDTTLGARSVISDADAIRKLDEGKVELSNGYDCDIEWTSGVIPEGERDAGEPYEGIQRNITGNHVAMVDAGRCGAECRIHDGKATKTKASECSCEGESTMADKALTKRLFDGIGMVEATDEAFSVIDKLLADNKKANDALAAKDGELAAKDSAHKEALTAKDTEIADLKTKSLDGAALDARVSARAKLVTDAKAIFGDDLVTDGKTDLAIQKEVVTKKLGDDAVKDKGDAFFGAAFEFMAMDAAKNGGGQSQRQEDQSQLRDQFRPENRQQQQDRGQSYEDRMSARWKGAA